MRRPCQKFSLIFFSYTTTDHQRPSSISNSVRDLLGPWHCLPNKLFQLKNNLDDWKFKLRKNVRMYSTSTSFNCHRRDALKNQFVCGYLELQTLLLQLFNFKLQRCFHGLTKISTLKIFGSCFCTFWFFKESHLKSWCVAVPFYLMLKVICLIVFGRSWIFFLQKKKDFHYLIKRHSAAARRKLYFIYFIDWVIHLGNALTYFNIVESFCHVYHSSLFFPEIFR